MGAGDVTLMGPLFVEAFAAANGAGTEANGTE